MENTRLYRTGSDSIIAGVCGGLGKHLKVDPIIFRILFVIAFFVGGSGLLVYIILWIVTPLDDTINQTQSMNNNMGNSEFKQPGINPEQEKKKENKPDGNLWAGIILITIGALFLFDRFIPNLHFGDLWPILLIVIGVVLLSKNFPRFNKDPE
ncbi:MAG: PspC domain-containing protein [Bacteroidales bacterium]|nr:PspC domain-containing protein [Bacteroidales bacterium]